MTHSLLDRCHEIHRDRWSHTQWWWWCSSCDDVFHLQKNLYGPRVSVLTQRSLAYSGIQVFTLSFNERDLYDPRKQLNYPLWALFETCMGGWSAAVFPCITLKCVLCVHWKGKNNKMPHWKHLKWLKHAFLLARLLVRLTIKQQGQTLTFCDLMTFSNVYTFMCWNSSVTTCIQTSHTKKDKIFQSLHFQLYF